MIILVIQKQRLDPLKCRYNLDNRKLITINSFFCLTMKNTQNWQKFSAVFRLTSKNSPKRQENSFKVNLSLVTVRLCAEFLPNFRHIAGTFAKFFIYIDDRFMFTGQASDPDGMTVLHNILRQPLHTLSRWTSLFFSVVQIRIHFFTAGSGSRREQEIIWCLILQKLLLLPFNYLCADLQQCTRSKELSVV